MKRTVGFTTIEGNMLTYSGEEGPDDCYSVRVEDLSAVRRNNYVMSIMEPRPGGVELFLRGGKVLAGRELTEEIADEVFLMITEILSSNLIT